MKVAALDLGSNTFLCLIAEVEANQVTKIYEDVVEIVRLGQGLNENKNFHPEALVRAKTCLQKFSEIIKRHRPEKILAMATSAARDAENRNELFDIGTKLNIPIEIILGSEEARITFEGATSGVDSDQQGLLVIDIGGGSTEFIFGNKNQVLASESYNIGCVRLTEKFIKDQPTPDNQLRAATEFIHTHIHKAVQLIPAQFKLSEILAVAGTPTALAAAALGHFDPQKIDGFVLTDAALEEWVRKLVGATVDEKIIMGIPAGRADVILIGAITLLESLKVFKQNKLKVSTRGVRFGVALEIYRRHAAN
ncbi:MAG: Ppx/GppA family phosphatase [Bdellovibrionaceae bacterium]|nr:Ppx/GppA family phosphatase [Bdellovibrio sp.]